MGNNDLWIAAHAKSAKLVLVTNNEREFQRVSGLEIQNWAKSAGPTSSAPK
jgi:tRNA(fMet)-specific endonuclease VapC